METVVFDLWGTLVYGDAREVSEEHIYSIMGLTKEDFRKQCRELFFVKPLTNKEFAETLCERLKLDTQKAKSTEHWLNHAFENTKVFDDVFQTLDNLRQKKQLYLISDTSIESKNLLERIGLREYFSKIFLSCEYGLTKKQGLYSILLKELKVPPSEILVIGNSLSSDYGVPKALGINTKLIVRDKNCANLPIEYITSLADICK